MVTTKREAIALLNAGLVRYCGCEASEGQLYACFERLEDIQLGKCRSRRRTGDIDRVRVAIVYEQGGSGWTVEMHDWITSLEEQAKKAA